MITNNIQILKRSTYIFLSCTSLILSSSEQGKGEVLPDDMKEVIKSANSLKAKKVRSADYKVINESDSKADKKKKKQQIVKTSYEDIHFMSKVKKTITDVYRQIDKVDAEEASDPIENIKEYKESQSDTHRKEVSTEVSLNPSVSASAQATSPLGGGGDLKAGIDGHITRKKAQEDKIEKITNVGDTDKSTTQPGKISTQVTMRKKAIGKYPVIQRSKYEGDIKIKYNKPWEEKRVSYKNISDVLEAGLSFLKLKNKPKNNFIIDAKIDYNKKIQDFWDDYKQTEDWPEKEAYLKDYGSVQKVEKNYYHVILAERYFQEHLQDRDFFIIDREDPKKKKVYHFQKTYRELADDDTGKIIQAK